MTPYIIIGLLLLLSTCQQNYLSDQRLVSDEVPAGFRPIPDDLLLDIDNRIAVIRGSDGLITYYDNEAGSGDWIYLLTASFDGRHALYIHARTGTAQGRLHRLEFSSGAFETLLSADVHWFRELRSGQVVAASPARCSNMTSLCSNFTLIDPETGTFAELNPQWESLRTGLGVPAADYQFESVDGSLAVSFRYDSPMVPHNTRMRILLDWNGSAIQAARIDTIRPTTVVRSPSGRYAAVQRSDDKALLLLDNTVNAGSVVLSNNPAIHSYFFSPDERFLVILRYRSYSDRLIPSFGYWFHEIGTGQTYHLYRNAYSVSSLFFSSDHQTVLFRASYMGGTGWYPVMTRLDGSDAKIISGNRFPTLNFQRIPNSE